MNKVKEICNCRKQTTEKTAKNNPAELLTDWCQPCRNSEKPYVFRGCIGVKLLHSQNICRLNIYSAVDRLTPSYHIPVDHQLIFFSIPNNPHRVNYPTRTATGRHEKQNPKTTGKQSRVIRQDNMIDWLIRKSCRNIDKSYDLRGCVGVTFVTFSRR